ncbi:DUF1565 domain-containing protein [bacterium]|nr:DUF1565 domain-containing protein [candidate division CSSED10-310 bacterium]
MKAVSTRLFMYGSVLIVAVAGVCQAVTWEVPSDVPTIQSAIDLAQNDDRILVAPGAYSGYGFCNLDTLGKTLTIESATGPVQCILSGNGTDRLFHIHQNETSTIIRGFTLIDGYSSGPGGGVFIEHAHVTLDNCRIKHCSADAGAGVCLNGTQATVSGCVIEDNTAIRSGGGIAHIGSDCSHILQTTIQANKSRMDGGGVSMSGGCGDYTDSLILDNEATTGAGIFSNNLNTFYISSVTVTGNAARYGGGLYSGTSADCFSGCIFTSNTALFRGGGVLTTAQNESEFQYCEFTANDSLDGGGVYLDRNAATLFGNCTFSSNRAEASGGAVYVQHGELPFFQASIEWSYFYDNIASCRGGAIYIAEITQYCPWINSVQISFTTFTGNIAGMGSDLCSDFELFDPIPVIYSTFSGNTALDYYVADASCFDFCETTSQLTPVNQDVYVAPNGSDSNNGLSWDLPFRTIQHAVSVLDTSTSSLLTVHVAPGTYSPSTTGERFPLPLVNHVTIQGADSESVRIDAEGSGRVFAGKHVETCALRNLTVTGGRADCGAGIWTMDSGLTVDHCIVTGNRCTDYRKDWFQVLENERGIGGGGIFYGGDGPGLTVVASHIVDNHSSTVGGGIHLSTFSPVVIGGTEENGNRFEGNTAGYGHGADLATIAGNQVDAAWNQFEYDFTEDRFVFPQSEFTLAHCSATHSLITVSDIYVSTMGSDDSSGLTSADPFLTVQHAVTVTDPAAGFLTIHLAPGEYSPDTTGERFPVYLRSQTTLTGDGAGEAVLDPQMQARAIICRSVSDVLLEYIGIRQGVASQGGGMWVQGSDIALSDVVITDCNAVNNGGGCHVESSRINATGPVTIQRNAAHWNGGGCFLLNPPEQTWSDWVIELNEAHWGGGCAVPLSTGAIWIQSSRFSENTAFEGGALAGGEYLGYRDTVFNHNHACFGGAIVSGISGYLDTQFLSNSARIRGGAIDCHNGAPFVLLNCILAKNKAPLGSALSIESPTGVSCQGTLHNCTLADNTADSDSAAIVVREDAAIDLKDCILWNNLPVSLDSEGGFNAHYCDVQYGWPGSGNIDADPLFVYGSAGQYYLSQAASGQFLTSPCADTGSDSASQICFPVETPLFCMNERTTRTDSAVDTGIVDMGFHYPPDASTPTPTPSPTSSPSPTPFPSLTPTAEPTNEPTPSPSPSETPYFSSETGVEIVLADTWFVPGDRFYCGVWVTVIEPDPLQTPLFVLLDVFGNLFFAPSFNTTGDTIWMTYSDRYTYVDIIPAFTWPETGMSAANLYFHAALTDPGVTQIIGRWDSIGFGYGQ